MTGGAMWTWDETPEGVLADPHDGFGRVFIENLGNVPPDIIRTAVEAAYEQGKNIGLGIGRKRLQNELRALMGVS